jgi:hypothetical protein
MLSTRLPYRSDDEGSSLPRSIRRGLIIRNRSYVLTLVSHLLWQMPHDPPCVFGVLRIPDFHHSKNGAAQVEAELLQGCS